MSCRVLTVTTYTSNGSASKTQYDTRVLAGEAKTANCSSGKACQSHHLLDEVGNHRLVCDTALLWLGAILDHSLVYPYADPWPLLSPLPNARWMLSGWIFFNCYREEAVMLFMCAGLQAADNYLCIWSTSWMLGMKEWKVDFYDQLISHLTHLQQLHLYQVYFCVLKVLLSSYLLYKTWITINNKILKYNECTGTTL